MTYICLRLIFALYTYYLLVVIAGEIDSDDDNNKDKILFVG